MAAMAGCRPIWPARKHSGNTEPARTGGVGDVASATLHVAPTRPARAQAATAAGRGYAIAGGVAGAIENCLKEYYPDVPVHIEHAESLAECKKVLTLAKAGKIKNCMIEGMACPGGCIGGAGTNAGFAKTSKALKKYVDSSEPKLPSQELENLELN